MTVYGCLYPGPSTYPGSSTYPGCRPAPAAGWAPLSGGGAGTVPLYVARADVPSAAAPGLVPPFARAPLPTRGQLAGAARGAVAGAALPLGLYALIVAGAAVLAWALSRAAAGLASRHGPKTAR